MNDTTVSNAAIVLQLILQGLQQLAAYREMMIRAQQEGRDITDEELQELASRDDAVRAALDAEIARQRAL